jgi:hypothetical protein
MAAQKTMALTRLEREAITDSVLKIRSIQASLEEVEEADIPDREDIDSCLEMADKNLRKVLTEGGPRKKGPSGR